ncbi:uncharacterized protein LOC129582696 [Paramacrobiotus metropolitanus]|uniref:uncharacterized protein LOC129582696 n=1 Tax=Paramacrobiotus metropolitanus TaxID=2943436 RepID=UPI0024459DB4|nr:uncharacterized protein LOC129582696 [Paramacrobiotus metropolitanus]
MARSPIRELSASKLPVSSLLGSKPRKRVRLYNERILTKAEHRRHLQQRARRMRQRRPCRFPPLCHHPHARYQRLKPYTRIIEITKTAPEDESLCAANRKYQTLCRDLAKDNARLKMENKDYREAVQQGYSKDLDLYESQHAHLHLRNVVAKFMVTVRDEGSFVLPNDLLRLMPNYAEIEANPAVLTPPKLSIKVGPLTVKKGVAVPPDLDPLQEEFQPREGAKIVRGVSQVAKSAKFKKRHTALPSDLLKSLNAASLADSPVALRDQSPLPSTSHDDDTRHTPTSTVKDPNPVDEYDYQREIDRAKEQTPPTNKRTAAALNGEAPKHRPRAARRSNLPVTDEASTPKKLCFQNDDATAENNDDDAVEFLIVPVKNRKLSGKKKTVEGDGGVFSEASEEDPEDGERCATPPVEAGDFGRGLRRSARATTAHIKSLKEPSLMKKMRRPVDIPALNPSAERKRVSRGTRGGSFGKSGRKSEEPASA